MVCDRALTGGDSDTLRHRTLDNLIFEADPSLLTRTPETRLRRSPNSGKVTDLGPAGDNRPVEPHVDPTLCF